MNGMGRPIRWHILATHVPSGGEGGGMVRYVVELAAALHRRPDIELSVLCSGAAAPFFTDLLGSRTGVTVVPSRLPVPAVAAMERWSHLALRDGPYDVIQGTKHIVPWRTSAIRALTVHDMLMIDRPQDFGVLKRRLLHRPYAASLRNADALLCVSEATRARLTSLYPDTAQRAVTVPLAMSRDLATVAPQPIPELVGRSFAMVVGDSSHRKNLPLVVDAWDEVCRRVPGSTLAVFGPRSWAGSSTGASYQRLIAQGRIVAPGRVPDAQLRWAYENAAVALCPSLAEGFGLPAVEALTFRAPLITSLDPALCEASGSAAMHLSTDRPGAWVDAMSAALALGRMAGPEYTPRTWDVVAAQTVLAVRMSAARPHRPLIVRQRSADGRPRHSIEPGREAGNGPTGH